MKIVFLLLAEYGEQSEQKMNKSPCSSRCSLAAGPASRARGRPMQRDSATVYIGFSLLYSGISRVPCFSGAAKGAHYPGTRGDIQAVTEQV